MPSKKAARQKKHCRRPTTPTVETLKLSIGTSRAGTIERDSRQIVVAIETSVSSLHEEQGIETSMIESSSQKSFVSDASTDEGSSSSCCTSISASHGSRTTVLRTSRDWGSIEAGGSSSSGCESSTASDDPATSLRASEGIDTCECLDTQPRPIWVDNGGATAWLLVMPRATCKMGIGSADASSIAPKDAILLGPFVAMKNTFLDETGIAERLRSRQLFRARSIGACRCGLP